MNKSEEKLHLLVPQEKKAKEESESEKQKQIDEVTRLPLHEKFTAPLALATFATTVGGSFVAGYSLVAMNTPEAFIMHFLYGSISRYVNEPSETLLTTVWSISVSIFVVFGCIGAFTFDFFAERFGRRNGLIICQAGSLVSVVFFSLAVPCNSFEMLVIARALVGWSVGALSSLVPLYLTEVAPRSLRGATNSLSQIGTAVGCLVGQVLGLSMVLGSWRWPILLALTGLPAVMSCAMLPWCPESPSFLLIKRRDEQGAVSSLRLLRQREDVSAEVEEILYENQATSGEPWSMRRLFRASSLRLPLALVCAANSAQQLSGIDSVLCYSQQIFTSVNVAASDSEYAVIGIGVVLVIGTTAAYVIEKKFGRRQLLLASIAGGTLLCIPITTCLVLQSNASWVAYLNFVWFISFIAAFTSGLAYIPQFLGAEMFEMGPRAPALSLAGLIRWISAFLVVLTFPFLQLTIDGYAFLIYAAIGTIFFVFFFLKLPETKDKTLAEVYEQLAPPQVPPQTQVAQAQDQASP